MSHHINTARRVYPARHPEMWAIFLQGNHGERSLVRDLIQALVAHGPMVLRIIKRAAYQSRDADPRTALDMISSHLGIVQTTQDASEAFSALRERRRPRFGAA